MANGFLTYKGEGYALWASNGSIAAKAASLHLYIPSSTPDKAGAGFSEPSGGGYASLPLVIGDWTLDAVAGTVVLADQAWQAVGGDIGEVAGVYVADGSGDVMAWYPFDATLDVTEDLYVQADDLTIQLSTGVGLNARLTQLGIEYMLKRAAGGSLTYHNAVLGLYTPASIPAVDGTGFVEVSGGGYAAQSLTQADWLWSATSSLVELQTVTFSGSSIGPVQGVFYALTGIGDILAWWPLISPVTDATIDVVLQAGME